MSSPIRGLVVQGGGMRGIYSMGALFALEELGLTDSFDHVVGSSAGAINGAFFVAKQSKRAVQVYLDEISNRKFVDIRRLSRIVDIDFLVDGVLRRNGIPDWEAVRMAKPTLHVLLTEYETAKAVAVTSRDTGVDWFEAMRATAALPILYDRVVEVGNGRFVDGGVADGVPLQYAIGIGCTDITVVITRPTTFRRHRPPFAMRALEALLMRSYPAPLRERILSEDAEFNQAMGMLEDARKLPPGVRVNVVSPTIPRRLASRTTRERKRLLGCALMGREDMRQALGEHGAGDNPFG